MKILLVRTSALGDIVHALPVLAALRRQQPEAQIAWAVEEVFAPLLAHHPDIDLLIPVATRRWRRLGRLRHSVAEIGTVRRALNGFAADVAIDLMGNHKGALLARASKAGRVIGAAREHRREPSSAVWIGEPTATPGVHAVDRMLDLLVPLGISSPAVELGGDHVLPTATPPQAGGRDRPYVMIQAGAGWANKQYPPSWWGRVAAELRSRAGVDVLVPVAPGERHLAAAVVEASHGSAELVEAGPWAVLVGLLRGCRLLLGGDTGPLHLAHALGTPVVCVMGPTDPARNGPYGAVDRVVVHQLPCSFCYKRLGEAKGCLLAIAPETVVDRALASLAY